MLVLSRKKHEVVVIDGGIEVSVVDIGGDKVRLGFTAPKNVRILRQEIQERYDDHGHYAAPLDLSGVTEQLGLEAEE